MNEGMKNKCVNKWRKEWTREEVNEWKNNWMCLLRPGPYKLTGKDKQKNKKTTKWTDSQTDRQTDRHSTSGLFTVEVRALLVVSSCCDIHRHLHIASWSPPRHTDVHTVLQPWLLVNNSDITWPGLPDRTVSSLSPSASGCSPRAKPGCCCCSVWQVVVRLSVMS